MAKRHSSSSSGLLDPASAFDLDEPLALAPYLKPKAIGAKVVGGFNFFVVEAPMGEGKTEASLLLADAAAAKLGQQGLFLGLPTRATANQLFGRIRRFLERTRTDEPANLLLAHGEASLVDAFARLRFGEVYGSSQQADSEHHAAP